MRGPFTLRRWESPAPRPGEAIVIEGRSGLIVIEPAQRMTRGEERYAKFTYWRVATRSAEQKLSIEAPAARARDAFVIDLRYVVHLTDAAEAYRNMSPDIDALVEIRSLVHSGVLAEASKYNATDAAQLQSAMTGLEFPLPNYLKVATTFAAVAVTDETKDRLVAQAAMEDELERLRREAAIDEVHDELKHEKRRREEANRLELITQVATSYDLKLDPLLLRALAIDDEQSPATLLQVRQNLANERDDRLRTIGDFFQALHDRKMLTDDGFKLFMDLAKGAIHDLVPELSALAVEQRKEGAGQHAIASAAADVTDKEPAPDTSEG